MGLAVSRIARRAGEEQVAATRVEVNRVCHRRRTHANRPLPQSAIVFVCQRIYARFAAGDFGFGPVLEGSGVERMGLTDVPEISREAVLVFAGMAIS